MKNKFALIITIISIITGCFCINSNAAEVLKYTCSAQVYESFDRERLDAFTKETGIEVDLRVVSSIAAVNLLTRGFSDIASTTRNLYYRHQENGYVQIPFCKDPLAVIVNSQNKINNLSEAQLQDIFSGQIRNWEEVGGDNQPIIVVLPGSETGAYKNFECFAMKRKELRYDLMTDKSPMVIEVVKCLPNAVSFIAQGVAIKEKAIKRLKIDNVSPDNPMYPYFQVFSFVTSGKPAGAAKAFIDFAFSEQGIEIMKQKGMMPIKR
jgi:phosphate transport system substrate-binding protein